MKTRMALLGMAALALWSSRARGNIFVLSLGGKIGEYTNAGIAVNTDLMPGSYSAIDISISGSDMYVLDQMGTVGRYTTFGETVNDTLISGLEWTSEIFVSGSNLYDLDYVNRSVGQYTVSGETVNSSLVSNLDGPSCLAVSGSSLYVLGLNNGTIAQYDLNGSTVNAALISGLTPPNRCMAVSGSYIYVANYLNGTVAKYTTSGALVNATLISGLSYPTAILVSGTDLYVANGGTGTVGKYTTSGATVNAGMITGLRYMWKIALGDGAAAPPIAPGVPIVNITPSTDVSSQPAGGQFWGSPEQHSNGMVGWSFFLLAPQTITQVGWYDEGHDGLSRAIQVGLWYYDGANYQQLLGDPSSGITIPGETDAVLEGDWRVIALPKPLYLAAGFYILGGLDSATSTDTVEYAMIGQHYTDPALTGGRLNIYEFFFNDVNSNGTFHLPQNFYYAAGLELGPMLFIAPEPSTLWLAGIGVLGLLISRRSRCRSC